MNNDSEFPDTVAYCFRNRRAASQHLCDGFTKASLQSLTRELWFQNEVQFLLMQTAERMHCVLARLGRLVLASSYECDGAVTQCSAACVIAANCDGRGPYRKLPRACGYRV
jgi:hypothetical protein